MSDYLTNQTRENNPNLWLFFEGLPAYEGDDVNDPACRRWQHTMRLAIFIRASVEKGEKYTCQPGRMETRYWEEYRTHDGEEHCTSYKNSVSLLDEKTYLTMKEKKCRDGERVETALRRVGFCREKAFDEVALLTSGSSFGEEITSFLARVKDIDAYVHFCFTKS